MKHPGEIFGELLSGPEGAFFVGVSSAQSALALAAAGRRRLYLGGFAEAVLNGVPDIGVRTADEVFARIKSVAFALEDAGHTDVLLVADLDTGYGGIHNLRRILKDIFTLPLIAGVHLEDQVFPKRCGHIAGREVVPAEEFCAKLRAAIDLRNERCPALKLIARTDALGAVGGGMEEAVRRGRMYAEVGADSVWCETKAPDRETAYRFYEGMRGQIPRYGLAYNESLSFKWRAFGGEKVTREDLIRWQYKFRFGTYASSVVEIAVVYLMGQWFGEEDEISAIERVQAFAEGTPAEDVRKFSGAERHQKLEERYGLGEKLRLTEGFGGKE